MILKNKKGQILSSLLLLLPISVGLQPAAVMVP